MIIVPILPQMKQNVIRQTSYTQNIKLTIFWVPGAQFPNLGKLDPKYLIVYNSKTQDDNGTYIISNKANCDNTGFHIHKIFKLTLFWVPGVSIS